MRHQPIDHPSVWRGPELLSRTDWRHDLTAAELREIDAALASGERLQKAAFSARRWTFWRRWLPSPPCI